MRFTKDTLYKGLPVILAAGYDLQNNGFFMTIEPVGAHPDANDETGMIYSNLDDPDIPFPGTTETLDHYRKKLKDMGIDAVEFLRRVEVECD